MITNIMPYIKPYEVFFTVLYISLFFVIPYFIMTFALMKISKHTATLTKYLSTAFLMVAAGWVGLAIINYVLYYLFLVPVLPVKYYVTLNEAVTGGFNHYTFLNYFFYKIFVFGAQIVTFIVVQYFSAIWCFPTLNKTKLLLWICTVALYVLVVMSSAQLLITESILSPHIHKALKS